ncbi:MAG: 50S ribosomal protein L30 [Bacteroidota bacterium]|nr:50S ribosomal protein L30 [Bacteroidota bacterium]
MAKLRITKIKSVINRPENQKRTMVALGLHKMNQSKEIEDTPMVKGMIQKVEHLLKIEKI